MKDAGCHRILWSARGLAVSAFLAIAHVSPPVHAQPVAETEGEFISALLHAYRWEFVQAVGKDGAKQPDWTAASRPRLEFGFFENSLGTSVCNSMNWNFQLLQGGGIRLDDGFRTAMACTDATVMELEARVSLQMRQLARYEFDSSGNWEPRSLAFLFRDGSRWEFSGRATSETRYGTKPQKVMFEIEPGLRPCSDGVRVLLDCMRVRQLNWEFWPYIAYSEWQELRRIEGYTHAPNRRVRLYVHRYHLRKQPVGKIVYEAFSSFSSDEELETSK